MKERSSMAEVTLKLYSPLCAEFFRKTNVETEISGAVRANRAKPEQKKGGDAR